ncbi:unnamed protein product, partial [Ectocarpus sp. 8 AP-2014]
QHNRCVCCLLPATQRSQVSAARLLRVCEPPSLSGVIRGTAGNGVRSSWSGTSTSSISKKRRERNTDHGDGRISWRAGFSACYQVAARSILRPHRADGPERHQRVAS